jgi:hypothetical protein
MRRKTLGFVASSIDDSNLQGRPLSNRQPVRWQCRRRRRATELNSAPGVTANIRELVVQLSRGNIARAVPLAESVRTDLDAILASDTDAGSTPKLQAQQTKFAIDEVRMLVEQQDLRGALDAARDAAKEWRAAPNTQE